MTRSSIEGLLNSTLAYANPLAEMVPPAELLPDTETLDDALAAVFGGALAELEADVLSLGVPGSACFDDSDCQATSHHAHHIMHAHILHTCDARDLSLL